jgi:hypothetical protein
VSDRGTEQNAQVGGTDSRERIWWLPIGSMVRKGCKL